MNPDTLRQILEPVLQQLEPDTLFMAYNYLSSAIAQAFAALIALTAMFYVYRRGIIINYRKEATDKMRLVIHDLEMRNKGGASIGARNRELNLIKMKTEKEILDSAKEKIQRYHWGELKPYFEYHNRLYYYGMLIYRYIITAIIISSATVALAILSLVFGGLIPGKLVVLRWVIIALESTFAILALFFTVFATIEMLKGCDFDKLDEKKKHNIIEKISLRLPSVIGLDKREKVTEIISNFFKEK